VRRIEYDEAKAAVIEWHIAEVHLHVGLDIQRSPVAQHVLFISDIAEKHPLVARIEPEHAAAAARV